MKTNDFALRLPDSLYAGLKAAAADNVAMNQDLTIAFLPLDGVRSVPCEGGGGVRV